MKEFIQEIEKICFINGDCGSDVVENAVTHLGINVTHMGAVVTHGEA